MFPKGVDSSQRLPKAGPSHFKAIKVYKMPPQALEQS